MRWSIIAGVLLIAGCATTPPKLVVGKGLWETDFNAAMEWRTWDGGHSWGISALPSITYYFDDRGLGAGFEGEFFGGHQRGRGVSFWYFGISPVFTFTVLMQDLLVEGWQTIPFAGLGFGPCFYTENINGRSESDVAARFFLRAGFKIVVTSSVAVNLEARLTYTSWSDRFFLYGPDEWNFGFYGGFVVFFGPSGE